MKKSRLTYLKPVLPILAGAIICVLIMWPTIKGYWVALQPRTLLVEEIIDEAPPNTAAKPRFLGVDAKNQPYVITADRGVELPDSRLQLDQPKMELKLKDGGTVHLSAHTGLYDKEERLLQLGGDVTLVHSDGYTIVAPTAWFNQNTNEAWSDQPVEGDGPAGHINAQGFTLKDNGHRIIFKGNSQLLLATEKK